MDKEDLEADKSLEILNKYFRTSRVEAHSRAIIALIYGDCVKKILGTNYKKERISLKKSKKIHKMMVSEFRRRYGPYVNVLCGSLKKQIWYTNFELIYKTQLGRLFSCGFINNVYLTSHCIDRWEERTENAYKENFEKKHIKDFGIAPTSLDTMNYFLYLGTQYGVQDENSNIRYLNMYLGVIVFEVYGEDELFVAKTFLSYDMVRTDVSWYNLKSALQDMSQILYPDITPLQTISILDKKFSDDKRYKIIEAAV